MTDTEQRFEPCICGPCKAEEHDYPPIPEHACVCGSTNCTRDDERADVLILLREWLTHYPSDVFPSAADGGDITGNAGAAARHVITCLIEQIEKGDHIGGSLHD